MLPRWSIAFLIVICLSVPVLFVWTWNRQEYGSANNRRQQKVIVYWVHNYGSGTYGYVGNTADAPLNNVMLILHRNRLSGQGGFITGTETEDIPAYWAEFGESVNIAAGKKRRFDFSFPVTILPADITVTVDGIPAEARQILDPL